MQLNHGKIILSINRFLVIIWMLFIVSDKHIPSSFSLSFLYVLDFSSRSLVKLIDLLTLQFTSFFYFKCAFTFHTPHKSHLYH